MLTLLLWFTYLILTWCKVGTLLLLLTYAFIVDSFDSTRLNSYWLDFHFELLDFVLRFFFVLLLQLSAGYSVDMKVDLLWRSLLGSRLNNSRWLLHLNLRLVRLAILLGLIDECNDFLRWALLHSGWIATVQVLSLNCSFSFLAILSWRRRRHFIISWAERL